MPLLHAIRADNITNAITTLRRDLNREVLQRKKLGNKIEDLQHERKKDRAYVNHMLQLSKKRRRQKQIKL